MAEKTNIAWSDSTINFWSGCTMVPAADGLKDSGCLHCYAKARDDRQMIEPKSHWGKGAPRLKHSGAVKSALAMNRKPWICDDCGNAEIHKTPAERFYGCQKCKCLTQHRRRIFSLSLGDWLDEEVPIEWLAEMLDTVRQCDQVTWILCTKRPELWEQRLMAAMMFYDEKTPAATPDEELTLMTLASCPGTPRPAELIEKLTRHPTALWIGSWIGGKAPVNVILLASVENQAMADLRIPRLLAIPAVCHGLSLEPLLGPVDISKWIGYAVANESFTERDIRLSGSAGGRTDNQSAGRDNLAGGSSTRRQVERRDKADSMHSAPGRDGQRGISTGESNDKQKAGLCTSSQACLHSLQGGDSKWDDNKSRRWKQKEQQAKKPYSSNLLRTNTTCNSQAENASSSEPKKRAESEYEAHKRASGKNQNSSSDRGKFKRNSEAVWNSDADSEQNSSRRTPQIMWAIIGGESGPSARNCNMDWIRELVEQGKASGVATFVKQLGANPKGLLAPFGEDREQCEITLRDKKGGDINEWPNDIRIQQWPAGY